MVKSEITRPDRPVFYRLHLNNVSIYTTSKIAGKGLFTLWSNDCIKNAKTASVEMWAILSPTVNKKYGSQEITKLLNGGWQQSLILKDKYDSGRLTYTFTNNQAAYKSIIKRLRCDELQWDEDFYRAMEYVCENKHLIELCFKSYAANVFHSAISLIHHEDKKELLNVKQHARQIWKFLRQGERSPM